MISHISCWHQSASGSLFGPVAWCPCQRAGRGLRPQKAISASKLSALGYCLVCYPLHMRWNSRKAHIAAHCTAEIVPVVNVSVGLLPASGQVQWPTMFHWRWPLILLVGVDLVATLLILFRVVSTFVMYIRKNSWPGSLQLPAQFPVAARPVPHGCHSVPVYTVWCNLLICDTTVASRTGCEQICWPAAQ